MAYLRALRLEIARNELARAGRENGSVASVANVCGFGHLGRFAGDYQTRFGKSPRKRFAAAALDQRADVSSRIEKMLSVAPLEHSSARIALKPMPNWSASSPRCMFSRSVPVMSASDFFVCNWPFASVSAPHHFGSDWRHSGHDWKCRWFHPVAIDPEPTRATQFCVMHNTAFFSTMW